MLAVLRLLAVPHVLSSSARLAIGLNRST
ncbi:MAG: hypothetical protein RLZZ487_2255, partial [Pseudomonadota bacterium]